MTLLVRIQRHWTKYLIALGAGGLVDKTLEPEGFLPVQPGDVVGYFMSREGRTGERDGIQLEPREEDGGEEVWYQSDVVPLTTVLRKKGPSLTQCSPSGCNL